MRAKNAAVVVCVGSCILAATTVLHDTRAQQNANVSDPNENQARAQQADVDRGKYIVHHVAMCIYCHTPRDERGVLDENQLLHGAPMPVESPFPAQQWAFMAPKIAGLPGGWNEDEMIHFLQSGENPTGRHPQLPMPPFRFTEEDARAVAAYLKSLN